MGIRRLTLALRELNIAATAFEEVAQMMADDHKWIVQVREK
jgi:hypothetical protein